MAPTIILVRVSMRLSFDDEEPFEESVGSFNFNNPPSDSDSLQRVGSISSMPPEEGDHDEDPNAILEVPREPVGSSSSMLPEERNEDPNVILEVRREPVGSSSPSQERTQRSEENDIL